LVINKFGLLELRVNSSFVKIHFDRGEHYFCKRW